MKKILTSLLLIFPFSFAFLAANGQTSAQEDPHTPSRCATDFEFNNHAKNNPSLLDLRNQGEQRISDFNKENSAAARTSSVPRIIPVVVHVLHQCGPENISKEQIQDEIRILNEDYRRLNADAAFTPAPFAAVGADCNIEFRLAQIDPNGNCTDGIVRVESIRTNSWAPRDSLKRVSYWPTDQYLNIWLVRSIYDANGTGGTILGYAHFPWDTTHQAITDGVVIRHDYFGSIGTAASSGNAGRVASHEVGHWLGLLHIWGDDNGACTGSDNCADTPNEADQIFGCPGGSAATAQFPYYDACTATGNGIMYMNYMDYTDGECQNIFTNNQKGRMDAVFNNWRGTLISTANLNATGTNGTTAVVCAPKAAVCQGDGFYVCQGSALTFNSTSYNADTMTYSWYFPGGNPTYATGANPSITYDTIGVYGFSLTATSSAGSDSVWYPNAVTVNGPATITPMTTSTMEDFELPASFPADGYVVNPDGGVTWQRVTNASYTGGVASIKINNYTNVAGEIDQYITPAYDISHLAGVQMKFRLANAQRSATSSDALRVDVSVTCGATWNNRYSKSGSQLATAGVISTNFTPTTASQWRLETVNPSASGATNVRFRFENTSDRGNNTYIDNINITALSVVGIEETEFETSGFHVYPNPASGSASITYSIATTGDVTLSVVDLLGREVKQLVDGKKTTGIYTENADISTLSKGVYFLRLQTPNSTLSTKFIVE